METLTTPSGYERTAMSRRSFIKAGAFGACALGASGLLGCSSVRASDGSGSATTETVAYTYHPMNCGNRCSLACTVRDGRMVAVEGNRWSGEEEQFSICCLKGMSEIQRVYSTERIQTPLRRTGERGSGEFTAISWDEALTEVAEALAKAKDTYGGQSILFTNSSSIDYPMPNLSALLGAQVACESGIDMGQGNGSDPSTGLPAVGTHGTNLFTWLDSDTIILVGNNILETGMTAAQVLLDAKENGAKLIVVDPVHTATASKADLWIPIKPGFDSALYLGMVSAIIDNEWYDEEFMAAHTSMPFLVDEDGALLRAHEPVMVIDESGQETPESGEQNPFLIWDAATASVRPYNDPAIVPALEGTYDLGGRKASTVFTLLKESQKDYPVEWASELTEIDGDTIIELARTYAQDGPAFLGTGFGGADKYANSDITGHAAVLLPALTGNLGKPGTGFGVVYGIGATAGASLGSWPLPEEFAASALEMQTPLLRTDANSVRVLISNGNAPVQHHGNWETTAEWLKSLDFVAVVDPFRTDTVNYADIVLPACTSFEMSEDYGNVQVNKRHVLLQQKVIEPLFESRSDFDIERGIAEKLDLAGYLPASRTEFVDTLLASSEDPLLDGIDAQKLLENRCIIELDVPEGVQDAHADQTYDTVSGRLDVYQEAMVEDGQALPRYEQNLEVYPGNPLMEKYPLHFWQTRKRYSVHSQFQPSTWIGQIKRPGEVRLNPLDAQARGLSDGDTVEVFNDRGRISALLTVDNSLRPGSAVMDDGSWACQTGGSNFQTLVNDTLIERGKNLNYGAAIPFYDTLVEVAKA